MTGDAGFVQALRTSTIARLILLAAAVLLPLAGCEEPPSRAEREKAKSDAQATAEKKERPAPRLVIYTAVDSQIATKILDPWAEANNVDLIIITDSEATKSVGLAERIRGERDNPQADVWWNNEPFHTIVLADEGTFEPYVSPSAADIPDRYKDPSGNWASTGLRARVMAITSLHPVPAEGDKLEDMTNPELKGKIAIARPKFGTTGGHVAALYTLWDEYRFINFFRGLRDNECKMLGGNSVVAHEVGKGTIWLGLTDNDDVDAARAAGGKLSMITPDQRGIGTLAIPTTVALVRGSREPEVAKQLIDYLLSAEVDQKLVDLRFAGWTVRSGTAGIKSMDVDLRKVARNMPRAIEIATTILEGRQLKRN
jgi:iron(III) transport system substrate-binding protein